MFIIKYVCVNKGNKVYEYYDVLLVCMREIGIMFIDIVFEMKGLVVIKSCFCFEIKFVIL